MWIRAMGRLLNLANAHTVNFQPTSRAEGGQVLVTWTGGVKDVIWSGELDQCRAVLQAIAQGLESGHVQVLDLDAAMTPAKP